MNNTFESITITKENEFAYYAALDVAIGTLLNPLVICGRREDTTLLLQAIRNKMIQNSLRTSVVLTEASSLMKAVDCYENSFQTDVVLIDRIDDILCSSEAQEKMIALFDHLLKKKKQMVFTIETPLDKVRIICERLYCRLSSGVIAEIESNV